jgi:hypothetical protein
LFYVFTFNKTNICTVEHIRDILERYYEQTLGGGGGYNPLWVCISQHCSRAIASSLTRFLDHTHRRATVGKTPLDE